MAHALQRDVRMRPKLRALIAEDDVDTLQLVAEAVDQFGAEVTCAETGDQLIERLAEDKPFDFVVTDVLMPWMTGLQALHAARAAGLATPVIVMTALRDPEVAAQAERLGSRAVLLYKPFDLDQLHAAIRDVLDHGGGHADLTPA